MATVTTTITPSSSLFPFTGYEDAKAVGTPLARANLFFSARDSSVAATGVGDNQRLIIQMDLPRNFAYVLVDYNLAIKAAAGNTYNMPLRAELVAFDAVTAGNRSFDAGIGLNSPGVGNVGSNQEMATYGQTVPWSGVLFQNIPTETVRVQADMFNTTANDGAYTVDVVARFLQFDIEQINNLVVNSAIPTR